MDDDQLLKEFGQRVKSARLSMGLSQEKLAFECDLDRTYISSIERGKRNLSLINIHKLATALRVNASALVDGKGAGR